MENHYAEKSGVGERGGGEVIEYTEPPSLPGWAYVLAIVQRLKSYIKLGTELE